MNCPKCGTTLSYNLSKERWECYGCWYTTETLINNHDNTQKGIFPQNGELKTMNPEKIEIDGITYRLVPDDGEGSEFRRIKSLSEREFGIDIQGKVVRDWKLNEFQRQDGTQGKVHSLLIGDESGTIKVALWGPHADTVKEVEEGDILTVRNGYTKKGQKDFIELHAGTKTIIELVKKGSKQEAL